jgi:hypothetical protein
MSYFYQYKFVSPDELFARIKEELKSYFDTGAVDDLMFPVWTKKCLQKLGRSSFPIHQTVLFMDTFEARLPPDFMAVREAWLVATGFPLEMRKPGAFYQQITTVLNKPYDACNPAVNCDPCNPDIITVVAKTTTDVAFPISLKYLLRPGNIAVREHCDLPCLNYSASSEDVFDIRDGKFVTNFRQGDIYLVYYGHDAGAGGCQMIPDNYRIQEFIEAFIKQKVFEMLSNQITDETFNQVQLKYQMYKQMADEAYIMADIEIKKETIYRKAYGIRRDQNRFDPYERMMYGNSRRWRGATGWPSSSWGYNDGL